MLYSELDNLERKMVPKYTPEELAQQLIETSQRLTGSPSNGPRVLNAWKDHQRELEQQLHDLQHGRNQAPP